MIKIMHLDMFSFSYRPIYCECESVYYEDGHIYASFVDQTTCLDSSCIFDVFLDTLFSERLSHSQDVCITDALESLLSISNGKENVSSTCPVSDLLIISPDDEVQVDYHCLIDTLLELDYRTSTFSYIAFSQE